MSFIILLGIKFYIKHNKNNEKADMVFETVTKRLRIL